MKKRTPILLLTGLLLSTLSMAQSPAPGQPVTTATFEGPVYFNTLSSYPVAIVSSDLDGDGKPDLAVANRSIGVSPATFSVYLNTTTGTTPSFARVDFQTTPGSDAISVGDLDGDGRPDLAITSSGSGVVSVFRNTSAVGNISFAPEVNILNSVARTISIGDLDGDGKPDLAVAGSGFVSIHRNIASPGTITSASFTTPVYFSTGLFQTSDVALGDLDGDGKPEMVTADRVGVVSVFRNTAVPGVINASSFTAKADFTVGSLAESVAVGDLDGDGKPELAVAKLREFGGGSDAVAVLRNTTSVGTINASSFATPVNFATGIYSYSVTIADMNGDSKPDLAVSNGNTGTGMISVLRNVTSAGVIDSNSFSPFVTYSSGQATSLTVSDFNGDAAPDIATANYGNKVNGNFVISVFRNTLDLMAPAAPTGLMAMAAFESVVLNWSPNTESDLASYTIYRDTGANFVLVGTVAAPTTTFTHTGLTNGVAYTYRISAVDALGNESPKSAPAAAITLPPVITSSTPSSGPIYTTVTITGSNFNIIATNNVVFFGATRATVTSASASQLVVTVPSGATYKPISVLNTMTTLTGYSTKPFVLTGGPGQGQSFTATSFEAPDYFVTGSSYPVDVISIDLDGDGKPDLATANRSVGLSSATFSVYRNTASVGSISASSFSRTDFVTIGNLSNIVAGDFDGDGRPDLAITSGTGSVSVFRNISTAGNISFAPAVNFSFSFIPRSVAIGDLDGDSKPDMAVAGSGNVRVYRNIASPGTITSASFATPVDFSTGLFNGSDLALGDLDGDSKPEMVTVDRFGTISVFRNTAVPNIITTSSFAPKVDFTVGFIAESVAIGDLNGDGRPELAVAKLRELGSGSDAIAVLRNNIINGTIDTSSFAAPVDFATGIYSYSVTIADMNGDGKPDLAVSNGNGGSGSVSVLRNVVSLGNIDSNSFSPFVKYASGQATAMTVSDLDGDAAPDIAVADYGSKVNGSFVMGVFRNALDVTPPAVPIGLTAFGQFQSVELNWLPDTESDLASYRLYSEPTAITGALRETIAAPTTTFTHNGLETGVAYTYRIAAVDLFGNESARSLPVTTLTTLVLEEDPTPPGEEEFRRKTKDETTAGTNASEEQEIGLYPNPSKGRLFITLPNASPASIVLMDRTGRVLQQNQAEGAQVILDVDNASKGLHLIRVKQENRVKSLKVIIE